MQIVQQPVLEVLQSEGVRFVIPVFQRVYSWNARQCEELWGDIMRAGRTGEPHFMGMLLLARDPEAHGGLEQMDVIDGQQRMTTLMLLLAALRPVEGNLAPLALSSLDRATLEALVCGDDLPEEPAGRLVDNYLLFARKAEEPGFDAETLRAGLCLLKVATVTLGPGDSPQLVFESLNSKGMALSTADRVRNLIVTTFDGEEQDRLFGEAWLPFERQVAQADAAATTTDVLHAWLAQRYRSVRILDESEVYGVFKTCLNDEFGGSLERALADVRAYGERFLADAGFRDEARARAEEWVAGKPEESVSEFKLFGD